MTFGVEDWESVVSRLKSCLQVTKLANILKTDNFLGHYVLGNQVLVRLGNPVSNKWHLLAPDGSLVE